VYVSFQRKRVTGEAGAGGEGDRNLGPRTVREDSTALVYPGT
jgi:hypothetical protein